MYNTSDLIKLYKRICKEINMDETKRIYVEEFLAALEPIKTLTQGQFMEVTAYFKSEGLTPFVTVNKALLHNPNLSEDKMELYVTLAKKSDINLKVFDEKTGPIL